MMEYKSDVLLDRICSEKQILQASMEELRSRIEALSIEQNTPILQQLRRIEKDRENLEALMSKVDSEPAGDVAAETATRLDQVLRKLRQSISDGFQLIPK